MPHLSDVLPQTTTVTFDCYGTLIDWRRGVWESLAKVIGTQVADNPQEVLDTYVACEAKVEAQTYRKYREVLAEAAKATAEKYGIMLTESQAEQFARDQPRWPVFPDTNDALTRLKKRFRLGVLSNVDEDLFTETARQFDITFDFVITAESVKSYKPAEGHFRKLLVEHTDENSVLHVAQSLYHDGEPAERLGIPYVWINRYDERNETAVTPLAEFPDLEEMSRRL